MSEDNQEKKPTGRFFVALSDLDEEPCRDDAVEPSYMVDSAKKAAELVAAERMSAEDMWVYGGKAYWVRVWDATDMLVLQGRIYVLVKVECLFDV